MKFFEPMGNSFLAPDKNEFEIKLDLMKMFPSILDCLSRKQSSLSSGALFDGEKISHNKNIETGTITSES